MRRVQLLNNPSHTPSRAPASGGGARATKQQLGNALPIRPQETSHAVRRVQHQAHAPLHTALQPQQLRLHRRKVTVMAMRRHLPTALRAALRAPPAASITQPALRASVALPRHEARAVESALPGVGFAASGLRCACPPPSRAPRPHSRLAVHDGQGRTGRLPAQTLVPSRNPHVPGQDQGEPVNARGVCLRHRCRVIDPRTNASFPLAPEPFSSAQPPRGHVRSVRHRIHPHAQVKRSMGAMDALAHCAEVPAHARSPPGAPDQKHRAGRRGRRAWHERRAQHILPAAYEARFSDTDVARSPRRSSTTLPAHLTSWQRRVFVRASPCTRPHPNPVARSSAAATTNRWSRSIIPVRNGTERLGCGAVAILPAYSNIATAGPYTSSPTKEALVTPTADIVYAPPAPVAAPRPACCCRPEVGAGPATACVQPFSVQGS
jgi:hypothetical protein